MILPSSPHIGKPEWLLDDLSKVKLGARIGKQVFHATYNGIHVAVKLVDNIEDLSILRYAKKRFINLIF